MQGGVETKVGVGGTNQGAGRGVQQQQVRAGMVWVQGVYLVGCCGEGRGRGTEGSRRALRRGEAVPLLAWIGLFSSRTHPLRTPPL